MTTPGRILSCTLLATVACTIEHTSGGGEVEGSAIDDRPVDRSGEPPPPITGGTLLVTQDGAFAIASDPDRDVVHVVDLAENRESGTIALQPGARPFRATEDDAGLIHITLRGTGEVATIDPVAGELVSTSSACPNPRGIAYHRGRNAILVACAGGELVELDPAGGVSNQRFVATDLRDVFVDGDATFVSRFRDAEVLEVRATGTVQNGAPLWPGVNGVLQTPGAAWRTVSVPGGGWLMLHQLATTEPLDAPPPGEGGREDFAPDGGGGYSGGGGIPCGSAVNPALTAMRPDGWILSGGPMGGIAVAVDVAIHPDGRKIAVASPSQHDGFRLDTMPMSLTLHDRDDLTTATFQDCRVPPEPLAVADFVAVAFASNGDVLAQTRSDPRLFRMQGKKLVAEIDLEGETIVDTGHDLFHLDTGGGIACASCHPEGGDDGRVWSFVDQGPRRTQALDAGVRDTEPFHWRGEMTDMTLLVHEVRDGRMGGAELTEARVQALQEWVFSIPQPNHQRSGSDPMAARGASLFNQYGCRTCHAGPAFTSNAAADLGRGPLQIPNLRGVAVRPPYMHDGRCATLTCATQEMVQTTNPGVYANMRVDDLAALIAYLETI